MEKCHEITEIIHYHTNNRGDLVEVTSIIIYKLQLTHALIEKPGEVEMEAYHKKKKISLFKILSVSI